MKQIKLIIMVQVLLLFVCPVRVFAQPEPGDIFKQYIWTTGDYEQDFLRVIGDGDYREPVNFQRVYPEAEFENGWLLFPYELDLQDAIGAEIMVEKLLSHDGTRGLSVKVNNSDWLKFPESENIPFPQWDYLHHTYPVVSVPFQQLMKEGNRLRFRVDSLQRFGMPQNILYGIHLRIYYNKSKKHSRAVINLSDGPKINPDNRIGLKKIKGELNNVIFIGKYLDVDYDGDGLYREWQYSYHRGGIENILGASTTAPWEISWDISWVPDQDEDILIAALVENDEGIWYFTEPTIFEGFERNYEVILCQGFNQPKLWATREGDFTMAFNLDRPPGNAVSFQLVWKSWSPGYLNGIYLNDWNVMSREGDYYVSRFHRITLDKPFMLNQGFNTLKTAKTPRVYDKMVHGAEILYPGFMMLVKFSSK